MHRSLRHTFKEVRKELNRLYQEGAIGINETINGKAVYVKEN